MIQAAVCDSAGGFEAVNARILERLRAWLVDASRELLQQCSESLGALHRDTLAAMMGRAELLFYLGKSGEAEKLFREALRLRRDTLGDVHEDTLTSMMRLAETLWELGELTAAEQLFRSAERGRLELLGATHRDTLKATSNVAACAAQQLYLHGKLGDEAVQLLREVLLSQRTELGAAHQDTCGSMLHLGIALSWLGEAEQLVEAEALMHDALRGMQESHGEAHLFTLECSTGLALLKQRQGRHMEAEPLLRHALRCQLELLGLEHPTTLKSMMRLADLLFDVQAAAAGLLSDEHAAEAEQLYREALRGRREALGDAHEDTLLVMYNLAALLRFDESKHSEREQLYREALRLRRGALGDAHADTLESMMSLADLLFDEQAAEAGLLSDEHAAEAEQLYREALRGRREALGDAHEDTLEVMYNLAALLRFDESKHSEREQLYREALRLRRGALGDAHADTLESMMSLADLLFDEQATEAGLLSGEHAAEAEQLYREALRGRREALGDAHEDTLLVMPHWPVH